MGLEAICICAVDGEGAETKALLESPKLILRAPSKSSAVSDALSATRYALR